MALRQTHIAYCPAQRYDNFMFLQQIVSNFSSLRYRLKLFLKSKNYFPPL